MIWTKKSDEERKRDCSESIMRNIKMKKESDGGERSE